MQNRTGQVLKGYELHEQIGAGGFGVVYRAYQPLLKRPVAIKAILPEYASQPDFIRRFELEAELVARLEHPHIIPLYDYWREPDGAYLVMRWVAHGSLRDAIDNETWDSSQIGQLVDQVTAALTVAHRHGVVHRDIKPDNILLDEDRNVYVADFGIAKDLEVADIAQGEMVGSPAYFAPEQIRGEEITPRTDLYSLGVMLFELLAGVRAFPDATLTEIIFKHLNEPLPALQEFRPELPAAVNEVLQRATAKNPHDRYESAHELAVAFRQAMASTPAASGTAEPIDNLLSGLVIDLRTTIRSDEPPPANPYKGLHSFQEADASDFFGRESLVDRFIERLSETDVGYRFLTVVGPSGSGKSSAVKAGLLPRLRQGGLPGSENWFIAQMVPGDHPLQELENVLLRVAMNPPENLFDALRADTRGLLHAVQRILPDTQSELVLVIDQFEEVFTQVEDSAQRLHLLESLYTAVTDPASQIRVILTLRADFYDRPLQYREFGELTRRRMESVLPLSPDELRQSIVAPAGRVGVSFQPELVEAILNDVGDQPGTLPLLQYALTELFERQQFRLITMAAYRDIGGITGALARRAEELYEGLSGEGQEATRQLFLRLVTLGEGTEDTRRRVRRAELVSTSGGSEVMDSVIDAYGRYRLLTFDRDPLTRGPTVEIAHEALLRVWNRLRGWIEDSREEVRTQRRLTLAAQEWVDVGDDPSYLASGARLSQFEAWAAETRLALNDIEAEFLRRSLAEREKQEQLEAERQAREVRLALQAGNRLRWLVAALAVFLVVALALTIFALDRQRQAETQSLLASDNAATAVAAQGSAEEQAALAQTQAAIADANARQAQALALAASSQLVLNSGDTDLSLLLAIEAGRRVEQPTIEIRRALTSAAYAPGTRFLLTEHAEPILDIAISPDGRTAFTAAGNELTSSTNGELFFWDLTTGEILRRFEGHEHKVTSVAFSPDGTRAISGDYSGFIILWDVATGERLDVFNDLSGVTRKLAFAPDGQHFVEGGGFSDTDLKVWDIEQHEIVLRLSGHSEQLDSLTYSPDGQLIASGARNGELFLWDAATGEEVRRLEGHTDAVNDLAFSPDGQRLLSGSTDFGMILWNVATGEQIYRIETGVVAAVAFSPDGRSFISGLGATGSGTITLWNAETGEEIRRYVGHPAPISSLAFMPDGRMFLSGSEDNSLRLWYTDSAAERARIRQISGVEGVAFSPDAQRVLSALRDGTVTLTDLATGAEIHHFEGHTDIARSVVFTPDGTKGLSASLDGTIIVWDLTTGERIRTFDQHRHSPLSVALSPDGKTVLSSSFDTTGAELDGDILVWNLETGEVLQRWQLPAISAALSPDGTRGLVSIASFGSRNVLLLDLQTGEILKTLALNSDSAWGMAFSPDGKLGLFGAADGVISLWDLDAGEELRRFIGHTDLVNSVAFSPDGNIALSAASDGAVIIWDVATGAEIHRFLAHGNLVRSVTVSPDGRFALSGGRDATIRLWRIFSSPDSDDVLTWISENRYTRELTCTERLQYSIEPLCAPVAASNS